jgi:hypothetical protein
MRITGLSTATLTSAIMTEDETTGDRPFRHRL